MPRCLCVMLASLFAILMPAIGQADSWPRQEEIRSRLLGLGFRLPSLTVDEVNAGMKRESTEKPNSSRS